MLLETLAGTALASGMSAVAKGGLVIGARIATAVPAAVGGVIIQSKINQKADQKLSERKKKGEQVTQQDIQDARIKAAIKGGTISALLMGSTTIGFNVINHKIWYCDMANPATIGSGIGNSLV